MRFLEIHSVVRRALLAPLVLMVSSCTTLTASSTGDPVFSITTDTMSILEADDGRFEVRLHRPICLVQSNERETITVTSRSGGTIREHETGGLFRLVSALLSFLVAIF